MRKADTASESALLVVYWDSNSNSGSMMNPTFYDHMVAGDHLSMLCVSRNAADDYRWSFTPGTAVDQNIQTTIELLEHSHRTYFHSFLERLWNRIENSKSRGFGMRLEAPLGVQDR